MTAFTRFQTRLSTPRAGRRHRACWTRQPDFTALYRLGGEKRGSAQPQAHMFGLFSARGGGACGGALCLFDVCEAMLFSNNV